MTIGFWKWHSPDGKRQYVETYCRQIRCTKYLRLKGVSNLSDLEKVLHDGFDLAGDLSTDFLIRFSQKGENIRCAYCGQGDLRYKNGKAVLANNIYKLKICKISRDDIGFFRPSILKRFGIYLDQPIQYYLDLDLPSFMESHWVGPTAIIVKRAILRRIIRCTEGLSKDEVRIVREFISEYDCENIVDNLTAELQCSPDEASRLYREFRKKCMSHFDDVDFEMELVRKLIDYDDDIYAKFEQAASERWKRENS